MKTDIKWHEFNNCGELFFHIHYNLTPSEAKEYLQTMPDQLVRFYQAWLCFEMEDFDNVDLASAYKDTFHNLKIKEKK